MPARRRSKTRYVVRTNPSTTTAPNPRGSKWDRCVRDVQASGRAVNAYAVCTKTVGPRPSRRRRNPSRYESAPTVVMPYRPSSSRRGGRSSGRYELQHGRPSGLEGLENWIARYPLAAVGIAAAGAGLIGYLFGRAKATTVTVTAQPGAVI